ncbi:cytochrome P450 [Patellaria atrata CBS 101060]|uniref:Cytochrome P450 n=1 Tax=Patellaria atrata CBS 101060 TaxID=1346257 RepID=A0A9P4S6Z7_9PEZI|nr:cytochrome P450 [Patellaria atrata CBS 101060]
MDDKSFTGAFGLSNTSIIFIFAILGICALHYHFRIRFDPREPPVIHHPVPYVGHIWGMFKYGAKYFQIVNPQNYPIYTLPTLTSRTYITTSPTLASLVQRTHPNLSFYSIILPITQRLCALDEPTMRIVLANANGKPGPEALMPEMHEMITSTLGPGDALRELTGSQVAEMGRLFAPVAEGEEKEVLSLYGFVTDVFTKANAWALYGPQNVFRRDPGLIRDFWTYEGGIVGLLADVVPWVTARKAWLARERLMKAFETYVAEKGYEEASTLIQRRVEMNRRHGFSVKMAGHAELIMLFGVLGNAVPTSFWVVTNIFSRPELLAELRAELEKVVREEEGVRVVSVTALRERCPLLISTMRETMRVIAILASVKYVLEDTLIADKYLLKANSVVQIASGVTHIDENIWGADAKTFNPRRFMAPKPVNGSTEKEVIDRKEPETQQSAVNLPKGVPSAAYRVFGGGSVICPGRHFAQNEIAAFTAMMVLGFDMEEADGGRIRLPEKDEQTVPLSVMKPKKDIQVRMMRREGFENVKWEMEL